MSVVLEIQMLQDSLHRNQNDSSRRDPHRSHYSILPIVLRKMKFMLRLLLLLLLADVSAQNLLRHHERSLNTKADSSDDLKTKGVKGGSRKSSKTKSEKSKKRAVSYSDDMANSNKHSVLFSAIVPEREKSVKKAVSYSDDMVVKPPEKAVSYSDDMEQPKEITPSKSIESPKSKSQKSMGKATASTDEMESLPKRAVSYSDDMGKHSKKAVAYHDVMDTKKNSKRKVTYAEAVGNSKNRKTSKKCKSAKKSGKGSKSESSGKGYDDDDDDDYYCPGEDDSEESDDESNEDLEEEEEEEDSEELEQDDIEESPPGDDNGVEEDDDDVYAPSGPHPRPVSAPYKLPSTQSSKAPHIPTKAPYLVPATKDPTTGSTTYEPTNTVAMTVEPTPRGGNSMNPVFYFPTPGPMTEGPTTIARTMSLEPSIETGGGTSMNPIFYFPTPGPMTDGPTASGDLTLEPTPVEDIASMNPILNDPTMAPVVDPTTSKKKNVAEMIANNTDLSTLATVLSDPAQEDLLFALMGDGPITIFAPNNYAFDKLVDQDVNLAVMTDTRLSSILSYHVADMALTTSNVTTGFLLSGSGYYLYLERFSFSNRIIINSGTNVLIPNMTASNGIIHIIDSVLLPPTVEVTGIILKTKEEDLSVFGELLELTNIMSSLQGVGPFTIFAPSNAAFEKLGASTLESLKKKDTVLLTDILSYHLAKGYISSGELVGGEFIPTLAKGAATIRVKANGLLLNDVAAFETTDLIAMNGAVHIIDTVLIPPPIKTSDP